MTTLTNIKKKDVIKKKKGEKQVLSDVETLKHGANRINNDQGKGNKRLQLHIKNLLFTLIIIT